MSANRDFVNLRGSWTYANDMDVMCGVQAHDCRALENLYLTYYGHLERFLSRVIAQPTVVDEVITDTFMAAWIHASDCRKGSHVAAWIFEIAYRTALPSMRPESFRSPQSSTGNIGGRGVAPASEAAAIEGLERRLSRLPTEERVTLALAYQMGFSIDEIAQITQAGPTTVESRMLRACAGLRDGNRTG